jgi:hypothetical protein
MLSHRTMRPKDLFITIIVNAVFAAVLGLLTSCSMPQKSVTQTVSSRDVRDALAEQVAFQADAGAVVSIAEGPVAPHDMPVQSGLSLLQSHCSGCHLTAWIDQIEKPRAEWEEILERMESMDVHLSDSEKDVLLDYLAVADN